MNKLLIIAGLLGATAVILGAFGAHGLKDILSSDQLKTYNTGISYHFYHVFALYIALLLKKDSISKWFSWSAYAFIIGILFFSGSLYLLSTRELIGLSVYKWLGPITPIGGVFFILGWICLAFGGLKNSDSETAL